MRKHSLFFFLFLAVCASVLALDFGSNGGHGVGGDALYPATGTPSFPYAFTASSATIGAATNAINGTGPANAFIGGGALNVIDGNGDYGAIVGGYNNDINSAWGNNTIIGSNNVDLLSPSIGISVIATNAADIGGGTDGSFYSAIIAGANNTISTGSVSGQTTNSLILGGTYNEMSPFSSASAILNSATIASSYSKNNGTNSLVFASSGSAVSAGSASGNFNAVGGFRAKTEYNGTFIWADYTDADFAATASNQFLVRASSGVGIGTNSPNAQLSVFGTGTTYSISVSTASSGSPVSLGVKNDGFVVMGNYGAGTATFDASGNITSVSDERAKNIVGAFDKGLSEILAITPVLYRYKKESGLDQKEIYSGFTTQDVGRVIPEAVFKGDGEGYDSLWERAITAALVNAVKELSAQVKELSDKSRK